MAHGRMVTVSSRPAWMAGDPASCFRRIHTDLSEAMCRQGGWLFSRGVLLLPLRPQAAGEGQGGWKTGRQEQRGASRQAEILPF